MPNPRVTLITGATGGLGRGMAERFGEAGDRVVIHYFQNQDAANALAAELERQGAEAMPFRADVRSLPEMRVLIEAVMKRWKRLDVLIANAAIRRDSLTLRTTEEDWDTTIQTNLTGVRNCLMAAGETFLSQREGRLIAIGSVAGFQGRAGQSSYAASKAGLTGLIRSVAMEWAPYNIQLNVILPGLQPTGITSMLSIEQKQALNRDRLLEQAPTITEVAEFVHLLSRMTGISGQIFNLDSRIL